MRSLLLSFFCFVLPQLAAGATLPEGLSGNFYYPAQSGHGVNVEVLDRERAVVVWHVYDLSGNPLTLYMDGRIEDDRIAGIAYAPRGMRFGVFDRSELQVPVWGELELQFTSCTRGSLKYSSSVGLGSGEIPLQRLAYTAACPGEQAKPAGRLGGFIAPPLAAAGTLLGVVMPEGDLWAITPALRPSSDMIVTTATRVITAPRAAAGTSEAIVAKARSLPNGFLCRFSSSPCSHEGVKEFDIPFLPDGDGWKANVPADGSQLRVGVVPHLPWSDPLLGEFYFDGDAVTPGRWQVVFGANGDLCIRAYGTQKCLYSGSFERVGDGPHVFELKGAAHEPAFRGVVITDFHQVFIGPLALHFIGSNGQTGLAFALRYEHRP